MSEMKKNGLFAGGGSEWNESEHPRDNDGKFTNGSGSTTGTIDTEAEKRRYAERFAPLRKLREITVRDPTVTKRITAAEWKEMEDGTKYVDIQTNPELQSLLNSAKDINEKRKIVEKWIMTRLRGKYATDDGREIIVSRKSADKLSHSANEIKIKVVPELADLIKVGTFDSIVKATHGGFDNFAYYNTQFKLADDFYTAVLNIGIKINGKETQSTLYEIDRIQNKKVSHTR
jgi:hypothetical protein